MKLYSYSPPKGGSTVQAIAFSLLGGAAALVMLGGIIPEYEPILLTAGFVLAMAGLLVCTRFLLSAYTYHLESAGDGSAPDLVIVENRGKVNRTVCRVSASGGSLFRYDKKERRTRLSRKKIYDYRPTPFSDGAYVYEVPERDGDGFVLFCPDEAMITLMQSVGCRVDG